MTGSWAINVANMPIGGWFVVSLRNAKNNRDHEGLEKKKYSKIHHLRAQRSFHPAAGDRFFSSIFTTQMVLYENVFYHPLFHVWTKLAWLLASREINFPHQLWKTKYYLTIGMLAFNYSNFFFEKFIYGI